MWGNIAIAFILAFVITFVTTPYTIRIAKKVGAVSEEKEGRRAHRKVMPKFGGPAVILGFLVSTIYLLIVMSMENSINLFGVQAYWKKLFGFLLGILTISGFCIIDDIKTINPITKLIGQVLGAVIVVASGIRIEGITLPFINFPQMHEISSIVITSVNAALKLENNSLEYIEEKDKLTINILSNKENIKIIIENMIDLLEELSLTYKENIKIIKEERP